LSYVTYNSADGGTLLWRLFERISHKEHKDHKGKEGIFVRKLSVVFRIIP